MNNVLIYSEEVKGEAAIIAQKHGVRVACEEFGMSQSTVLKACKDRGVVLHSNNPRGRKSYDLELAVMHVILEEGCYWVAEDIGDICNVSHQAIRQVEATALKKIRKKLGKAEWEELKEAFYAIGRRHDAVYP